MKVLYLGYFQEKSSWNDVAVNYVKALSQYCEVVCQPITIHGRGTIDPFIHDLIGSPIDCTHVIQHVLPYHMEKGNIPCVGFCISETDSVSWNGYSTGLQLMDQVWTPSRYHAQKFSFKYVPHTFNMNDYDYHYDIPNELRNLLEERYTFYTIGEMNVRKRLSGILRAFNTEFSKNDEVALLIKTSKSGVSHQQLLQEIKECNDSIVQKMNLRKRVVEPIIIPNDIPRQDIMGLHSQLSCYVNCSYGEAFCVPAFEAAAFHKPIIAPNIPGIQDYVKDLCSVQLEPCFGAEQYLEDTHTSKENWWSCNLVEMAAKMRYNYENNITFQEYNLDDFSYENVGKLMFDLLREF